MRPTRLPLAELRAHGRAEEVVLPHETGRVDAWYQLLDDCLATVVAGREEATEMDWFVARSQAACLWQVERECFNAVSLVNEWAGGSPADQRRRQLAETAERAGIVRHLRQKAADILEIHRGFLQAYLPESGVIPFRQRRKEAV